MNTTISKPSKIITPSKFKGYDYCANPYVGCQMGCNYCYVRFFIKDKNHEWGDFVRVRDHIEKKLPKEMNVLQDQRLVIGTMTDPYQPSERKYRVTRRIINTILNSTVTLKKVGIFTRSPIVADDIDIIKRLPKARVHYTITPYRRDILMKLEPVPIMTQRRFDTIKQLKDAGIRVHVNVAPSIPFISDEFTEDFTKKMVAIGVDEFFVDPMQAYTESFQSTFQALKDIPEWMYIQDTMTNHHAFTEWKKQYRKDWEDAWKKHGNKNILAIWSDHITREWIDMNTGKAMDHRTYGDDIIPTPAPTPPDPIVV